MKKQITLTLILALLAFAGSAQDFPDENLFEETEANYGRSGWVKINMVGMPGNRQSIALRADDHLLVVLESEAARAVAVRIDGGEAEAAQCTVSQDRAPENRQRWSYAANMADPVFVQCAFSEGFTARIQAANELIVQVQKRQKTKKPIRLKPKHLAKLKVLEK